ncbi:MAG: hypothetical protein QM589_16095 [Thermomicrobiales bacterium]
MSEQKQHSSVSWIRIGGATIVILAAIFIATGWLWDPFGSSGHSMHGAAVITSHADFVRTGDKTATGNERYIGAGSRAILQGDQQVTVRPSKGDATNLVLEEGFVNEDGACEM